MTDSKNLSKVNHQASPYKFSFVTDDSAVSSIEYALLGSLIVAAIVTSVNIMGSHVLALYELVRVAVEAAM